MKLITQLALIAFLPFLSGCVTSRALDEAKKTTTKSFYDSVSKVEKAVVTKDGQLCIFFEKDLTNSAQSHFTLIIPLAQIQTNAQVHRVAYVGDRHDSVTYGTLHVPGNTIRAHWTLLENPESNLIFVQVGTPIIVGERDDTYRHDQNFILLPNAKQTIYLTRTTPIEFVYVDASTNRSFTIITVDPIVVSKKHPAYYALLPLTIPADIALSPYYAFVLIMLAAHGSPLTQ